MFFSFWGFDWKCFALWQKKLSDVVKNSSYVSRRLIFWLEKLRKAQMCSFRVITAKKNLRKLFGRLVKSVLVLSTVKFRGKLVLWRLVFFLSEILSVSFIPYGKTSSARLSKFHLACPQKFFWEKLNLLKFSMYFHHSSTLSEFFRAFPWKKKQEGLSKQNSKCPEDLFPC